MKDATILAVRIGLFLYSDIDFCGVETPTHIEDRIAVLPFLYVLMCVTIFAVCDAPRIR
jgi:hypothetical protein